MPASANAAPGCSAGAADAPGPIEICRPTSTRNSTPSKKYMPRKPIIVNTTSPDTTFGEAASAVFIKP